MPKILVYSENGARFSDQVREALYSLTDWEIIIQNSTEINLIILHKIITEEAPNFLIYITEPSNHGINLLIEIRKVHPLLSVIYCSDYLSSTQFNKLSEIGIDSCAIGKDSFAFIPNNLNELWQVHWKQVPKYFYNNALMNKHAYRSKKIISYIENNSIKKFNTANLSGLLHISRSHFRSEFKQIFGVSFRNFKQTLLKHYESRLLMEYKYRLCDIRAILNYSSESNISKSFKTRHGLSLNEFKRIYAAESKTEITET